MSDQSDKTLKILIQLGVIGENDVKAAKELLGDINKDMGVVNVTQEEANRILEESAKATDKATLSKHTLKEVVKKLTADFPLLGEAARMAFNPIVLGVAGPILAFKIWNDRVNTLADSLSEVEMPDFDPGKLSKVTEEWNGLAEAIAKANKEFNAANAIFDRNKSEIDKQLDADKKLLDIQKQKALINLEKNKGHMTEAEYTVNKAQIESRYELATLDREKKAREERLAARYSEEQDARNRALAASKAAAGVRIEDDEESFKHQQDLLKQRADKLAENEKKHREEVERIVDADTVPYSQSKYGLSGALSVHRKYGLGVTHDKAQAEQEAMADQARREREAIEAEIARRDRLFKTRQGFQEEAGKNAGIATDAANQIGVERRNFNRENAVAAAIREFKADYAHRDAEVIKAINELRAQVKANSRNK